jgi:hypothetical protein
MRFIAKTSEDTVLSNWFLHEATGRLSADVSAFLRKHPQYTALIKTPNRLSQAENQKRAILCWLSRGAILFELPLDIEWFEAEISEKDFKDLLVIEDNWWSKRYGSGSNKLSVISNAVNLKKNHLYIKFLLGNIEKIDINLIVIGRKSGPFTIIDGVHRAIAMCIRFFLLKKEEFIPFKVFAGVSQQRCVWQRGRL